MSSDHTQNNIQKAIKRNQLNKYITGVTVYDK